MLISSSSLPGNLFINETFVVLYSLGNKNKIETVILLDTDVTGVAFIDKAMARYVCDVLQIFFIQLAKPKPIKKFDDRPALLITHAIYPTLTVQGHIELLAPMLVTTLGQHLLILEKLWIRKHRVILDMSCNKLAFWSEHCQHLGALLALPAKVNTELHTTNSTTSTAAPAEPQKVRTTSKKVELVKIPQPIAGIQLVYRDVSKLAVSKRKKYVIPAKRILKPATVSKSKAKLVDKTKLIDLAFIGGALFMYLVKQKDVEIFAIQ